MNDPRRGGRQLRRAHVPDVHGGIIELAESEAHHFRDVLRMKPGQIIELFDDAGRTASAEIISCSAGRVAVRVDTIEEPGGGSGGSGDRSRIAIVVASAVPKGDRADWMIEKLSELGVSRYIPLNAQRSVVVPEGKNKRQRWMRIATEAAAQSRRSGVMSIDSITNLADAITHASLELTSRIVLTTGGDVPPLPDVVTKPISAGQTTVLLLVGPEGGWTDQELAACAAAGLTGAKLTATILRIETAAVAAAAIVASMAFARGSRSSASTLPL